MVRRGLVSKEKGLSVFGLWAVLLIAALFPAKLWAQSTPTVKVYGNITQNDKNLEGAIVTLYANGSQTSQNTTDHSGRYQFVLQLDMNYMLEFTKPGYITKRITFSTFGPSPERRKNPFDDFNFDVDIFPEVPGVNLDDILKQPIGKVVYDPNYNKVGNFNFDAIYTKQMQDVIAKLLAAKKAAEEQFRKLVQKADGEFGQKDYTNAKTDYTQALLMVPEDSHCKKQLAAIDKALKDADANASAAAQQKALQAKYDSIIKLADAAFKTPDYPTAKAQYNAALKVKSDQQYPRDQLAAIDKALANKADADKKAALAKAQQAKYDSLIKLGDAAFGTKNWAVAKTNYNAALQVKSDQQYPKDQLAAIDKAMAADADAAKKAAMAKALQAKYDSLIKLGDAAFNSKNYAVAKTDYTAALQVKSDQQYPKDQLAAIDKALAADADAAKKAAMAKALQAKYDSLIKIADGYFNSKKYPFAKTNYNLALQVKSTEQYPKDQLAAIDKAMAADADAAKKAAAEKALQARYDSTIKIADAAFGSKNWAVAKTNYNAALKIKPAEQYPKDQLAAIDKAIAAAADAAKKDALAKAQQAKYDSIIKIADAAFGTKDYKTAKTNYNGALKVKPDQQYPKDQLAAIDKALGAEADAAKQAALAKAQQAKYDSLIKIADAAFNSKNYSKAKTNYNGALQVKSDQQYPKDQLAAIDKAMAADADAAKKAAAEKALQARYDSLIKVADVAFKAKKYDNAKAGYNGALQIKPDQQYPKDQLAAIDKALGAEADATKQAALAKALQAKYDSIIKIADAAFKTKDYSAAKLNYNAALQVKDQQYPKDQIAAIDKALAALAEADKKNAAEKALQAKYDSIIKIADAAFNSKSYAVAKTNYNAALQVKSKEQYPKDQLAAIDKALAADADAAKKAAMEKALQAKYDSIIKIADASFNSKDYSNAKTGYNSALKVKPSEQYPKDQLAAIDKAIAAADADKKNAAQRALQAKYDSIIKIADAAFNSKDYSNAKTGYNSALKVKPSEQYPKDQLAAIDKAIAAAEADKKNAAQRALQAKYDSIIKIADAAFNSKDYNNAKTGYNSALKVKPSEQYPKDQLAAIDKALASAADAARLAALEKAKQAKYDSLIKIADAAFKAKTYSDAKTGYNAALQVKPSEQYPKDQLAAIDKALADQDAANKAAIEKAQKAKYDSLIRIADNAFKTKNYSGAKVIYNNALQVKSDEQYPKDQIAAIDKLLASAADAAKMAALEKAKQAKYDSIIKIADAAFNGKNYKKAKAGYNAALEVKSDQQYPKDQLAAIDKALADMANAEKNAALAKIMQARYDSIIKIADAAFNKQSYDKAKGGYNAALQVKPAEQYPKDQIAAIDKAIADAADAANKAAMAKAAQAKYDSLIKIADKAFAGKNYSSARSTYNAAIVVKGDQQYPKDQIAAIDKIIAQQAGNNDKYNQAMSTGNQSMLMRSYQKAVTAYTQALSFKPGDPTAKDRLAQAQEALNKQNAALGITTTTTTNPVKQPVDSVEGAAPDSIAKKYPQGTTEEHVDEPGCEVTRRIIVKGTRGWIYTRKTWNWGQTYYFKGDLPITEDTWARETGSQ